MRDPFAARAFDAGTRGPVGVDTERPSLPRVQDYWRRGRDNYDADRAFCTGLAQIAPGWPDVMRMGRLWRERVVRYLAGPAGIRQFVELGAGFPAMRDTHSIAQEFGRPAVVVYLDHDPVVTIHGRVLLGGYPRSHFERADITDPGRVLDVIGEHVDLRQPVALLAAGILPHIGGDVDPGTLMRTYIDALAPGSHVALTHFLAPHDGASHHSLAADLQHRYLTGLGSGWFRSRDAILGLFHGVELIEPGLVPLDQWWPLGPAVGLSPPEQRLVVGGVGAKTDSLTERVVALSQWRR
ncbi:SAM-dependent methyltransferase [Nocardia mexicana]|uniref:S-adenosyl methyltransferase n=1 Tax=Nocardia mexicana TaxID=279262 RepID=A0A370GJK6_9NOCA|nr:SAM-dependent methyltransferase [Nocardia mexicana]RDI43550.1 S-adenosyl methyltransferase [Nocardia mexicana]